MLGSAKGAQEQLRPRTGRIYFRAQMLRGGKYTGEMSYDDVAALARNARGQDRFGYRGEFIQLVNLAQSLAGMSKQARR